MAKVLRINTRGALLASQSLGVEFPRYEHVVPRRIDLHMSTPYQDRPYFACRMAARPCVFGSSLSVPQTRTLEGKRYGSHEIHVTNGAS
jgi:hypothetical protein